MPPNQCVFIDKLWAVVWNAIQPLEMLQRCFTLMLPAFYVILRQPQRKIIPLTSSEFTY